MKSLFLFFLIVLYKNSSLEAVKEGPAGDSSLVSELAQGTQIAADLTEDFQALSNQNNQDDMGTEDEPENAQTDETDISPHSHSYKAHEPPQHSVSFKRSGSAEEKSNKLNNNLQIPVSDEDIEIAKRTPVGRVRKVQKYKSLRIRNRNHDYSRELTFTGSTTPYDKCVDIDNLPPIDYEGCTAVRFWSLFRHGSRFPGGETIIGMRTRLKNLREAIVLKYWESVKNNKPTEEGQSCYSKELEKWKLKKELIQKEKPLSDKTLNEKKSEVKTEKKKKGEGEIVVNTKSLTPEGKKEVFGIGTRFMQKFGDIIELAKQYTSSFIFKFTDCERTKSSAQEIYRGAFGLDPKSSDDWFVPVEKGEGGKDPLLKYDSVCKHWKKNYKKSYLDEYDLESFKYGKEINNAIEGLQKKCGFSENSFTFSDGKVMYEACAYEKTWPPEDESTQESSKGIASDTESPKKEAQQHEKNPESEPSLQRTVSKSSNRTRFEDFLKRTYSRSESTKESYSSPWCDLLSPEYQEVFEYLEDFEFFKNDGPQNLVSKELGCIVFQDMVKRLIGDVEEDESGSVKWKINEEDYKDPNKETKLVTFYFTHLTALLKFIAHVGLFDDPKESLRGDNFDQMKERKWRSSQIGCFATNITFVLMNCGRKKDGEIDYKILTLFQEKPVSLPGCPWGSDLCPLETFLNVYRESIFRCRYNEICKADENPLYKQAERLLGWQRYSSDKSIKYAIQKEIEAN